VKGGGPKTGRRQGDFNEDSSTIFSFLKLVCSFWQIARLQEFFINYRIGSHKHLDKLLLPPFVVVPLLFHHLLLPG